MPVDCRLEVLRFLGCLALAWLDFRLAMHARSRVVMPPLKVGVHVSVVESLLTVQW